MSRKTRAFIDAIEGEIARVLVDNRVLHLPTILLPEATGEGSFVDIDVTLIEAPPADTEARRTKLTAGDDGSDLKL